VTASCQLSLGGHVAREAATAKQVPALPLRPYQQEALDAITAAEGRGVNRAIVALPTGCHRAGQGLLMHEGSVKAVEDVQVDDRLMGPDSQPRTVLALARGTGAMMEIRPVKGAPWVVNDEHVLTLVETQEKGHGRYPSQRGGAVRDVALPDWWQWSANRKHRHMLFRVPVDFPEREAPPLDPYFLGVLLGDGTLATPYRLSVTTVDPEILVAVHQAARSFELRVHDEGIQLHLRGRVVPNANPIVGILRGLGLNPVGCGDRFIPDAYRLGSRQTRLTVLAGLLDTDGSYRYGGYEFASRSERLANDVAFIARGLGLAAYVTKRPNGHYRTSISGNCSIVPCRIPRKQAPAGAQKKDVLRTGFQVAPTGTVEPYYGFTLSGDGRYLLDDFTVTHNTGKTVLFGHLLNGRDGRGLVLAHRDELIGQAAGKLRQIAPSLEVGIVKAERDEIGADVVVASIQTLARPSRLARLEANFRTIVVDEAHHASAATYVAVLRELGAFTEGGPLTVGVTATPERADKSKLGAVWQEIVYQRSMLEMIAAGYLVDLRAIQVGTDADLGRLRIVHGDLQDAEIADELIASGAIPQVAGAYLKHARDRKGIAFTPTVRVAHLLAGELAARGIPAEALDGTTPTDERRAILGRLHEGSTRVVVNCGVLTEGFDEPSVDCILIARPTKSRPLYCLDAATEILTDQGWRGIDDALSPDERAAGFDLSSGGVEWTPILGRIERALSPDERMYRLTSAGLDVRVTDQHRMVHRRRLGKERVRSDWMVDTAERLAGGPAYEIPVAGIQKAPGVPLSDDEIRFVGWFLTDGTINKANNAVTISQAEHQPQRADLEACLHACRFKYSVHIARAGSSYKRTSPLYRYAISKGKPRDGSMSPRCGWCDTELRGWGDLEPYIDKNLAPALEDLDHRQIGILLEAIHLGDGAKQRGQSWMRRSWHISTGNLVFAERLQSLCVRRGFRCNLAVQRYNRNPLYILHIKPGTVRGVAGGAEANPKKLTEDAARPGERLWCIETGTRTIITRRNGKVAILGNCQMVGRGTRPYPGKADCLILDLAGVAGRHDLATVAELAGVDPAELEGKTITEALGDRQRREADEEEPDGDRDHGLRLPTVTAVVPLFRSQMHWLKVQHEYVLSIGSYTDRNGQDWGQGHIHLVPTLGDTWRVEGRRRGRPTKVLAEGLSLEYAQGLGEDIARRFGGTVARADAAWRSKPAKPAQLEALKRWHVKIPAGTELTRGEAADLLTQATVKARNGRR